MRSNHSRRRILLRVAGVVLAVSVFAVVTYGRWGYTRHLAVEAYPVANAPIYSEFQFAVEYRKRFDWLPGSEYRLVAVERKDVTALRRNAIAAFDWSADDVYGSTYCFASDCQPLPGWSQRDPLIDPAAPIAQSETP